MRKLMSYLWLLALLLAVLVAGCSGNGGVAAIPDTIAPTVISTQPVNGDAGVSISSIVTATFSKVMHPSTITTATFTLMHGTTPVAGTVTYAGTTATFTPTGTLATNTTFTATITTGVRDLRGNILASNNVWTFKTTSTPSAMYAMTVNAVHGSVTKSPNQVSYDAGTAVTLTVVPATGYHFTGWSGDLSGATSPAQITMTGDKTVTANFKTNSANTYTLTAIAVHGSVMKSPNLATYNAGTAVTLTAVPATGYHFTGWSGDLNSATSPTQITMTGDKIVTAGFAINTYTLTVNALHGSVTKSPNQVSYDADSVVTLTAAPTTGYHFTGWSGNLSGATSPAQIMMTGDRTVTANFALNQPNTYTLTVIAVHGSVTKTPNQTTYNAGTVVTLTAVPASGYHFSGWSDDINGTTSPAQLTMLGNKSVTASFALDHLGPTPIDLGSAGNFAILAGSTVTNTGPTIINGNLGVSPGTAVTGFSGGPGTVNGTIFVTPDATVAAAKLNLTTASNDAAGRAQNVVIVSTGELGGLTLAPGLYKSGISSFAITLVDLTLDAQGDPSAVWIFQMPSSTLTVGNGCKVILTGGAQANNIYWQVGSSATLGTTSVVAGNILAQASITLRTGATLNGRALTQIAAISLDSNTVTIPASPTQAGRLRKP